ncbi:MAG: glycerol kinase [Phycisphaerae bacterium]|nr:glycerol kinase [Phycisphaerae bacterium]
MSERFILSLDEGTSSLRTVVFDLEGSIRGVSQQEFEQIFPKPGLVEHDASEIWRKQHETIRGALEAAGITAEDVDSIGITNQRETILLWDRSTSEPIHNAIVWQDRRTTEYCNTLQAGPHASMIRERTGLVIDPYFSGSKLKWLLDHVPDARERAARGELAAGTIDSWLIWKLTGGRVHATDVTNACRTMLFNIHTGEWDDELLEIFDVPRTVLPEVVPTSGVVGMTDSTILETPVPISGIIGDQQSALFGQLCVEHGMAKSTYGTGCFMLMNTGETAVTSDHQLLTTVAWQLEGRPMVYALEGSVFIAGAAIQWLRDGLQIIGSAPEVNELAASVPDTGGVKLVPAFAGMGAPYWNPEARGSIHGITRGTNRGHIARATLESLAYQAADLLNAMTKDSGVPLTKLRVDGGAAVSDLLMQMQADLLDVPVERPRVLESTALGAAYMAGLGTGVFQSVADLESHREVDRDFHPEMSGADRERNMKQWHKAVERSLDWTDDEEH